MDKFFTLVYVLEEYSFPFRLKDVIITEANVEAELKASMAALKGALLDTCVRFLRQLLNKLILLIVHPPVIGGQIGIHCSHVAQVYIQFLLSFFILKLFFLIPHYSQLGPSCI